MAVKKNCFRFLNISPMERENLCVLSFNLSGLVADLTNVLCLVAQSCPILCSPLDYSPPGPSAQGIIQARILEWVAIPFSRGSSQPRDWTQVSHMAVDSLPSELPRKKDGTDDLICKAEIETQTQRMVWMPREEREEGRIGKSGLTYVHCYV